MPSSKPLDDRSKICLGVERFAAPEILFHPSDVGLNQMGVVEAIGYSLNKLPQEVRFEMLKNIVLVGGNTFFENFKERVELDLRPLLDEMFDFKLKPKEMKLHLRSNQMQERNQDATIYVGGLDEKVSESVLWELFVQSGPVASVNMPKDRITGSHQGFGFVEFMGEEDADYAIKIMNMIKLYGKPIKVNKASANEKNMDVGANLFVGNLDAEVDEKLLFDTFSAFGVILQVPKIMRDTDTGNSKGFAFINFASFEASDLALEAMNGQYLCNRPITCSYAFKKDTKGERHGTAAERLLAAQNPLFPNDRPHQVFSDIPGLRPMPMAPPMPPMMGIGGLGGMPPPQMQGMQQGMPGMQAMQQGMQGMPGVHGGLQMPPMQMQMPGQGMVPPPMRPPQGVSGMFPPPPPMTRTPIPPPPPPQPPTPMMGQMGNSPFPPPPPPMSAPPPPPPSMMGSMMSAPTPPPPPPST
uniref:Splicing factor 3B subunit 4 n=1 Tax=Ditylenchus dipsaci TaxID=166011 RepID=A0A915DCE8_9BILA